MDSGETKDMTALLTTALLLCSRIAVLDSRSNSVSLSTEFRLACGRALDMNDTTTQMVEVHPVIIS